MKGLCATYIHTYIHAYKHVHTDRQTDGQTDKDITFTTTGMSLTLKLHCIHTDWLSSCTLVLAPQLQQRDLREVHFVRGLLCKSSFIAGETVSQSRSSTAEACRHKPKTQDPKTKGRNHEPKTETHKALKQYSRTHGGRKPHDACGLTPAHWGA